MLDFSTLSRLWLLEGLQRRIQFFFVAFVLIIAFLYAYAGIWAIEFTESSLLTRVMEDEIASLEEQLDRHEPIRLAAGYRLYGNGENLERVPDFLLRLPEGYNELETSPAIFVLRHNRPDGDLFLTLDQETFEADEQLFVKVMGISLVGILLIALFFVSFLSRMVFRPVKILTDAVSQQMIGSEYRPLDVVVSKDEIGHLANMCDRALRELHEALDREKAFTGDVSHELRTPLTVIRTSAELLELQTDTPYARRQVERILKASDAMQELIDLFLEFSRSREARTQESANNRGVTLAEIAEELQETWLPRVKDKGLDLSVIVNVKKTTLFPSLYLRTVLSNLIRNAMNYTAEGGIYLIVKDDLCLVADTGPGIASDDRERIFSPFERGSASVRYGEGVGLGLSIVVRMADRLGWQVELLEPEDFLTHFSRDLPTDSTLPAKIGAVFALHLTPVSLKERKRKDEA